MYNDTIAKIEEQFGIIDKLKEKVETLVNAKLKEQVMVGLTTTISSSISVFKETLINLERISLVMEGLNEFPNHGKEYIDELKPIFNNFKIEEKSLHEQYNTFFEKYH